MPRSMILVSLFALVAGCRREPAAPPAPAAARAASGWYRAVLGEAQGEPIPFFLKLPESGDGLVATGPQTFPFRQTIEGAKLALRFPPEMSRIEATRREDGSLQGTWTGGTAALEVGTLSFSAAPVAARDPAALFPAPAAGAPPASLDPIGVFKLEMPDSGVVKLKVERAPDGGLMATISFLSGNVVILAGAMVGGELRLAGFDGSSPYLLLLSPAPDGAGVAGRWRAGPALGWSETFRGVMVGEFELPARRRAFSDEVRLPKAVAGRLAGKPLVIELAASWCGNCAYAAPALRELYDRHHPAGVEFLTLLYELSDDSADNARRAAIYQQEFGIPWQVLAVDGTLEQLADNLPITSDEEGLPGFPLILFVTPQGRLQDFQSGCPPPESGEAHRAVTGRYRELAEKLVATARK